MNTNSYDPLVDGVTPPPAFSTSASTSIFEQLEHYPWSIDADFQSGFSSILASQESTDTPGLEQLVLQARCFYFGRKHNTPVDPSAYSAWRLSQSPDNLRPLLAYNIQDREPSSPTYVNGSHDGEIGVMSSDAQTGGPSVPQESATTSVENPPYSASFAEIMRLIETGQPIPGIRAIPDTVLQDQASEPTSAPRRKPWERADVTPAQTNTSP